MVIGGRAKTSQLFAKDEDFLHLVDIIAKTYSKLPSEVLSLDWEDFLVCARCVALRSKRASKAIKSGSSKKGMIFPVVDLTSMIDVIG